MLPDKLRVRNAKESFFCDVTIAQKHIRHYIENTIEDEELVWVEVYKSDRVVAIPVSQWLALTPPALVAQTLKVPIEFVQKIKKEKQVPIA